MPSVLTTGSTVKCAHQGTVKLTASQNKLKIGGKAVLVQGDLDGATISGCTTPSSQSSSPCKSVTSMIQGAATKLKVGGMAVLLDTAMGLTDGVPPAPMQWNVQSAGQNKLTAS